MSFCHDVISESGKSVWGRSLFSVMCAYSAQLSYRMGLKCLLSTFISLQLDCSYVLKFVLIGGRELYFYVLKSLVWWGGSLEISVQLSCV